MRLLIALALLGALGFGVYRLVRRRAQGDGSSLSDNWVGGAPPPPPPDPTIDRTRFSENGEPYVIRWPNGQLETVSSYIQKRSNPGAVPRGRNPRDYALAEIGWLAKRHGTDLPIKATQDDVNHLSTFASGSIGYTEALRAGNDIAATVVAVTIPGAGKAIAGLYYTGSRLMPPPAPPPGLG